MTIKCQIPDTAPGALKRVLTELDLYRLALTRIADAESGIWGTIAAEALKEGDNLYVHDC